MAGSLSTQLEGLRRERERLEELLMLDANWRALRQLEEREAAGQPLQSVDGAGLKASLEQALGANRIYAARAKLLETIDLLAADFPVRSGLAENGPLSSRIVMLSEPSGDTFRARLRLKPEAVAAPSIAVERAAAAAGPVAVPVAPDPLELIDGLSRRAVEVLLGGGVTRFADIAQWTSVEVATWRARLEGATQGSAGGWIEQAALLASGQTTRFAERVRRGEFAALVPAPQSEPPARWSLAGEAAGAAGVQPAPLVDVVPPALPDGAVAARGVTAEELARVLDRSEALPPPLPEASAGVETAREAIEADVLVVAAPAANGQAKGMERPRTLLRRIKALRRADRFEADDYAAYRGAVEEASVTILSSPEVKPAPNSPGGSAGTAAEHPASRFLKALTGKS